MSTKKTILKPGMVISHLGCPNAANPIDLGTVVKAKGRGILLERDGNKYRIPRVDMIRVVK